jgi:hypothetical protein
MEETTMSITRAPWSRQNHGATIPLLACALILWSCGGDSGTEPLTTPTVASVEVSPASPALAALGETVQMTASARDASGGSISGKSFAWMSSDPGVATVSLTGLVTAASNGTASVSAMTDGVTGSASVTVQAPTEGSLRFLIATVGRTLDPDGYSFVFDGADTTAVEVQDTVTVHDLDQGQYPASLLGLAPNCYRFSMFALTGTVVAGQTTDVPVGVECLDVPEELSIAFVRGRNNPDSVNIVGLLPGATEPTNLTFNPAFDRYPRWSPDGSMLAFIRDGRIKIINADGTGLRTIDFGESVSWSPSGTRIAYDDGVSSYTIRLSGFGNKTSIGDGVAPAWSPDGTKIAIEVDVPGGEADIFVVNPDGTDRVNITGEISLLDREPVWSPDGAQIAFRRLNRSESVGYDVWVMDADGSNQVRVVSMDGPQGPSAWLPDDRILLWSSGSILEYDAGSGGPPSVLIAGGQDFAYWDATWRPVP